MTCKRIAKHTTKQDSQLFDNIYSNLAGSKEELADELYVYFESDSFKEEFGDWIEDFKLPIEERVINQRLVDDNGEPRLILDSAKAKYYYTDKNGKKVYYPNNINKLQENYSEGAIRQITKILALNFIKPRIGDNFNDFNLSEQRGTLSESIRDTITSKANELMASEDLDQEFKGETLQESLLYLDEWVRNVNNYFKELKLNYNETTQTEEIMNDENNTRSEKTFGVSSFERSTKENVSTNVKLRLSLLTDITLKGEDLLDDLFYEPTLIPFDEVHSSLQGVLTNNTALEGEDLFEIMLSEIYKLSNRKPYFKDLADTLSKADDNIKAEFVQAFNLDRNNFIGSIVKIEPITEAKQVVGYKTKFSVQNLSNVGGKTRAVKNDWFYNFTKKYTNEKSLVKESQQKDFKENNSKFSKFKDQFDRNRIKESYDLRDFEKDVSGTLKQLSQLGIETNQDAIGYYLDGLQLIDIPFEEKVKNLAKLLKDVDYTYDAINENNVKPESNPFDLESELTNLAKANAFYISEGSDSSIFSAGKSKWIFSYPSYLSTRVKQWEKDPSLLLDHYNKSPYNQGSYFMERLLGLHVDESSRPKVVKERLDKFNLHIFNSLQEEGDASNAVDSSSMSKNDAFADLYNKTLGFRVKGTKSYMNTPTPADKLNQFQLGIDKDLMLDTNARYSAATDSIKVNDKAIKVIYKYVVSEFNRIKQVKEEIEKKDPSELKVHYHLGNKNGLKFQLLTSLNYDKVDPNNKDKRIKVFDSTEAGFELYDKEGNILDFEFENIEDLFDIKDAKTKAAKGLISVIEKALDSNIREMTSHLYDVGMLDRVNGETVNRGFATDIWNSYADNKGSNLKIASDIFINNLISQVEYSKMFAGDVAYYKNMVDYKKRIPATYTDGLQLYLRPGEEYFNVSVIEGVEVATPYLNELKEYLPKDIWKHYENVNSTDAQAWITPERWRFLKQRLGKWSNEHDVVYDKMMGNNSEPMTGKELKMAAQPLKGVYFEINDGAPVYLKYSQAVLIPGLVKNNKGLQTLLDKMTKDSDGKKLEFKNQIHELITIDGVKVGANNPVGTHNADYSIKDDFTLTKMPLKNSGWKLQQDLPTKTYKDTDIGSQIQKNIFAGLANNLDKEFEYEGKIVTGKDLINIINDIITNMSNEGLKKVFKEFGVTPDYKITNPERLRKSLIEELKSRGSAQNIIDALESNMTTYGIPGQQQKIQNVFASMILKRVIKIQSNGGSFIQLSNYGFNRTEANENGVRWTPWAKETTHEPESYIDENGKERIRPGGVLVSGSFIAKYIPDWQNYTDEELFVSYNGGQPIIDNNILKNLIGYRIPNQGLASNDALEVVGILPESAGDTVVAYTGITTKTGSDFDIDKMYMMIPTIKVNYNKSTYKKARKYIKDNLLTESELKDELISEGYSETFINSTSDIQTLFIEDILLNNKSQNEYKSDFENVIKDGDVGNLNYDKDALENKLIQAYKSVLTHPDVIKDVMTPIDFEFMKDNIVSLFPQDDQSDLSAFNIKNEVNLKYEFIAGKAGVGITANQLVDHVRGMMANLQLKEPLKALENPTSNVKLDNEYSEELSEKDLKDYAKLVGKPYSEVKGLKKIKIANSLSALMNAYVDIAKDPYVTRGNWTTQTANVGMMLVRAGVHPFKVNAIIGQPIIREYIDFVVNSESKLVNDTSSDMASKFLKKKMLSELRSLPSIELGGKRVGYGDLYDTVKYGEAKKSLKKKYKKITDSQINDILTSIEEVSSKYDKTGKGTYMNYKLPFLNKSIKDPESIKNNNLYQLGLFKDFKEWNEVSKDLVKNIDGSKSDVNGYGKNISSLIINYNLNRLLLNGNNSITGFNTKLEYDGKPTMLQTYINNSVDEIKKIMENNPLNFITAHPTVVNTFNSISQGLKQENLLDQKLGDKLEKNFYTYMMSGFAPFNMDIEKKESLLNTLPAKVLEYKKNNTEENNPFLDELTVNVGEDKKTFLTMSNRKKSPSFENDIITGWKDLLENEPKLGEDLIKYAFFTSGLNMTMNQFYTYIPYEWFAQNNINEYISGVAEDLQNKKIDMNFYNNFFRTNVSDSQVVPNIFPNNMEGYSEAGFTMREVGPAKPYVKFIKETTNPITNVTTSTTKLFKLEGYTPSNKGVYTRTTELGYKDSKGNRVVEDAYNLEVIPTMYNKIKGIITKGKSGNVDLRDKYKDVVEHGPTYFHKNINEVVDNKFETEENIGVGSSVTFEDNGNYVEGVITRKAVSEENSYEIQTEDGFIIKNLDELNQSNIDDVFENDQNCKK